MPLDWHIIGIRISGNMVGLIQITINLLISIEKIQNLCSNSSSECVLLKTFRPCVRIPYCLKAIVETVKEGHISTLFLRDYGS